MSFSKVIAMATTIVAAILLMVSTAATAELKNENMNPTLTASEGERGLKGYWNNKWKVGDEGGGETKKIEDMSLIPAPEVERGMKGYWNKWKLAVEGFHFPHLHFPHIPNISFSIPISIPFPPFHIHDLHLDQPSSLATSAQPPAPSAQPPAYILN
ncbi:hypothetical protein FEM48_Zijuj06G0195100 [Ziziphus jujuba var. spinosa]|uniref:Uncharacterized protein n=1 Tax=Ziziphus jujuba var. spinosa TaxID=714518 RepID=A0A978VB71_ZIZJJ|nr:hypothetical protein FEM48_Zijuj06G0195100 [Ziziphus jujuba var. spinosa]